MYKYINIFFSIYSFSLFAQLNTPKYSNEFLDIGVGARGMSMSRTQVSSTNDITSGYWNPAGLTGLSTKYEASYMHSDYFAGIAKYDYLSIGSRLDTQSVLSLSYIRFGIDNIPDTRFLFDNNSGSVNTSIYGNINYDRIKLFSATDNAFFLSYARLSKNKITSIGGNLKVINRNIGEFATAWGFGVDLGLKTMVKKWNLGFMARDLTSTFNFWNINGDKLATVYKQYNEISSSTNTIPKSSIELTLPRLIAGISRAFKLIPSRNFGILTALDADITTDGKRNVLIKTNRISIDPHAGVELFYKKVVFIRGGIGRIQEKADFKGKKQWIFQPDFGIGFKIKGLGLDYAFSNPSVASGLHTHFFSVKLSINKL